MSWLARDDAALHYEVHGSTPAGAAALVLVHGLTCDGSDWSAQAAHFADTRGCVTLDLRGMGRSLGFGSAADAYEMPTLGADVAALVDHLGLERVVLAGHSMGCRVVLEAARVLRERTAGVVLVDGSRFARKDEAAARAAVREMFASRGAASVVGGLFEQMFNERSDAAARSRIIERALRVPEPVVSALMQAMSGWDASALERVAAAQAAPVLALQSTYVNEQRERVELAAGDTTPYLDDLRRSCPIFDAHVLEGIAHFTMIDAASEVNTRIEAFCSRAEASAVGGGR